MKKIYRLLIIAALAPLLAGCVAVAAGAGAAGGYYFGSHYKVEKKK